MLSKFRLLLQSEWWKSMFGVLLRTLIAGLVPLLLAYAAGTPVAWKDGVSQTVLLLIVAVLTSLAGIPIPGTAPYWEILLARFLRQFAQFLIAGIGTAVLFSDVHWVTLLLGAASSAVSTVLIGSLVVVPVSPVVPVDPSATPINVYVPPASPPVAPDPIPDPILPPESDIPTDVPQMGA